jgi:hypothetical protein
MTNKEFIKVIERSFNCYLNSPSGSRSTAKLKSIHGSICEDIQNKLGKNYVVYSQGTGSGKEIIFNGRYEEKRVDIGVQKINNNDQIASIEVKFVMQNYKQNSINYFYSMLGETANLRCNRIKCYQILILLNHLPYFKDINGKRIDHIENVNLQNLKKYINLSMDNPSLYFHTPNKTLIFIVNNPQITEGLIGKTPIEYRDKLTGHSHSFEMKFIKDVIFDNGIILNDYEDFIKKITHQILGE